jgi:asparaginyl-tRNA synthetase
MRRIEILQLLKNDHKGKKVKVNGWVRTFRNDRFIALNDGSTIHNLQIVVDVDSCDEQTLKTLHTGAALEVIGLVVESQGKGQHIEIQADEVRVLGIAHPDEYPLQPKKHSLDFLREKAHLRMRTSTFSAVFRVRHAASFAIHKYFHDNGFFMMHSPIITGSDAEGAGEMFRVTQFDLDELPKDKAGKVDNSKDFFGKTTNLWTYVQGREQQYIKASC